MPEGGLSSTGYPGAGTHVEEDREEPGSVPGTLTLHRQLCLKCSLITFLSELGIVRWHSRTQPGSGIQREAGFAVSLPSLGSGQQGLGLPVLRSLAELRHERNQWPGAPSQPCCRKCVAWGFI